jgi:hypothetical protein
MSYDEYYWKSDSSPEFIELMSKRWRLRAVKNADIIRRFHERMPTSLASSTYPGDVTYYISANWLAGEKGDLYCVMNDNTDNLIIIRYYYNF